MRSLHGIIIGAVLAASPFTSDAALACNPIEALFGGCRQSAEPAAPAHVRPGSDSRASRGRAYTHVRGSSLRYATVHARPAKEGAGRGQRQTPLAPPEGVAFGSVEHFAADPTLRSGDVVVTARGFLVYRDNASFKPLDSKRASLASLEKASRAPAATTWQSRSLAEWSPAASSQLAGAATGVRTVSFSDANNR